MEPLRREVMAPRSPVGWLGPLFVLGSTMALTMAMAAMALTPRSRHCHRSRPAMKAVPPRVDLRAVEAQRRVLSRAPGLMQDRAECGAPVYRAMPNGMVDATFEVCARPSRR